MADAHKKDDHGKKDEKKGSEDHGIQVGQSFVDWIVHRMMENLLPWGGALIAGKVGSMLENRAKKTAERPAHLVTFGEVMTKLAAIDLYSFEVIKDFMAVELTAEHDRDDFQVRTAKMGGENADPSVAFLQLVAAEPNHAARREFLDAMGLIGERAIDPLERTKLLAEKAGNFVKTRGIQAWAWIKTDLDGAFATLTAAAEADSVRLRAELARRRAENAAAATPPAAPAGGNYFTRLLNAVRGR